METRPAALEPEGSPVPEQRTPAISVVLEPRAQSRGRDVEWAPPLEESLQPPGVGPVWVRVEASLKANGKDQPAGGFAARLVVSYRLDGEEQSRTLTKILDPQGVTVFEVEAIEGLDPKASGLTFLASIVEPGYTGGQRALGWKEEREEYVAKLKTRPGSTLHGRVVGVDGRIPGSPCYVALLGTADPDLPARSRPTRSYVRNGRFALDLSQRGTFTLAAHSHRSGSQRISGLTLNPDELPGDFVVQLEGAGSLAGRVLDPEGYPVASLYLDFQHADEPGGKPRREWSHEAVLKALPGGHRQSWARTDPDGHFEVHGLKPGRFRIYDREGKAAEIGGRLWPTEGTDIELIIDAHELSVEVRDAEGQALEVSTSGGSSMDEHSLSSHVVAGMGRTLRWRKRGDAWVARAQPNVVYDVAAWGAGYGLVHERVSLGPKNRRLHVELTLPAKQETARLVVQPLTPNGEPLPRGCRVTLYPDASPRRIGSFESGPAQQWKAELPPGHYRLEVQPEVRTWGSLRLAHWLGSEKERGAKIQTVSESPPPLGGVSHAITL